MKAMILRETGLLKEKETPLECVDLPRPQAGPHELLIKISVCGVCHTELDEIEGRTPPSHLPMVPGHQIVGVVVETGSLAKKHQLGDRVGIGWIWHSDGSVRENVSPEFKATGRDANGGYAEYICIDENYAFAIPELFTDEQAAPLLCAGSIGYRALQLTQIKNGDNLGLTGFGGSAHLVLQLAKHQFPDSLIYVFARDPNARSFALGLGATWAGATKEQPPRPLHAIIDTTPAWTPVVYALKNLHAGGRLVINAIRKEQADKTALLELNYEDDLWMEREIKSVANITARDIAEFLPLAAQIPIIPATTSYVLEDANRALLDLKTSTIRGAKVLQIGN